MVEKRAAKWLAPGCGEWFGANFFAAPGGFSELGLVSDSSGFTDYNDTLVNPKTKPEVGLK